MEWIERNGMHKKRKIANRIDNKKTLIQNWIVDISMAKVRYDFGAQRIFVCWDPINRCRISFISDPVEMFYEMLTRKISHASTKLLVLNGREKKW